MASKRKGSEGIALLSMYNDEDEDMDDAGEEVDNKEDTINSDSDSAFEAIPQLLQSQASIPTEDSTPRSDRVVSLTPQKPQASLNSPLLVSRPPPSSAPLLDAQSTRKGTLAIVDYAHDETAMSPEAEEGEIVSAGCVMFGEELQTVNDLMEPKFCGQVDPRPLSACRVFAQTEFEKWQNEDLKL